jgi:hypothetical protein
MRTLARATLLPALVAAAAACGGDERAPAEIPEAVQRAFDASCVEGCHDAATREEGLILAASHSARIVGGASWQSDLPLVRVGDLGGSYMAIKLLPDAQLPAGAMRFESRMPRGGIEPDDIANVNTILAWIAGYGPSGTGGSEGPEDTGPTGTDATAGDPSAGSGDATGTSTTSTDPTDPDPTSNTGNPPAAPACSVETVTQGAVTDPLDKGDAAGQIPTSIGVILEERCGCHTLADRTLNVEYPGLLAPADSLWLDHADLARPLDGTTLGEVMEEEVLVTQGMPPGSCPTIPADDLALLETWFLAGRPDGAAFMP